MATVEGVYKVVFSRRVVIHIVKPSLPAWSNLLDLSWEHLSGVGVLDPSPLVLVLVTMEVFVVPVSELISADESSELVSETTLVVRWSLRFSSEDSSHEAFFPVELPELGTHHSDGHTPRSHV